MKKEIFIAAGKAAYGEGWKSPLQRDLGVNHRQRISQWVDGVRPVPELQSELISILNTRKSQIESAINTIESDFIIQEKENLTAVFFAVSEGGHLLDERFETLENAQTWINENFEEDDLYLASVHQVTLAQLYALDVMQNFSDIYDPEKVLEAIQSNEFKKTEQEYCLILSELDERFYGKEYYAYLLESEFSLRRIPSLDHDDFEARNTMSYKQFIMKRIAALINFSKDL